MIKIKWIMKHFNQTVNYLEDAYKEAIQDALFIIDHLDGIATPEAVCKHLPKNEADDFYVYKAKLQMTLKHLANNGVQFSRWVRIPNWNSQDEANKKWYNYNKKWEL